MRCGLIGERLSHSHSVRIHQMLGSYRYELISLPPEELGLFLKSGEFDGMNVTIPYKKAVIPYCDNLDDVAQRIGCVNTIVRGTDGALHGYNTDYFGFLSMCDRAGIQFDGAKVLVLGSGGTSLTAAAAASDRGAREVVTVSRSGEHNYSNLSLHKDSDVIINTTPVGMYPNNGETLIDLYEFPNCAGVVDVIYNPLRTRLLLQAEALGVPHTGGLPMLVAQAVLGSSLFTGEPVQMDRIDAICNTLYIDLSNIVLIGMPGSGKTGIGSLVAEQLGRELIDTDSMIVQQAGRSIPAIFAEYGEPYFRDLEAEAVEACGKLGGKVIATGGGSILRAENLLNMKQNGVLIFLERELECLSTDGRPLSTGIEALRRLYADRFPIYKANSTATVTNNGTEADAANAVLEVFHALFDH